MLSSDWEDCSKLQTCRFELRVKFEARCWSVQHKCGCEDLGWISTCEAYGTSSQVGLQEETGTSDSSGTQLSWMEHREKTTSLPWTTRQHDEVSRTVLSRPRVQEIRRKMGGEAREIYTPVKGKPIISTTNSDRERRSPRRNKSGRERPRVSVHILWQYENRCLISKN